MTNNLDDRISNFIGSKFPVTGEKKFPFIQEKSQNTHIFKLIQTDNTFVFTRNKKKSVK